MTGAVGTTITLQQATTAKAEDPMVTLEVEPSLVRVRDATSGLVRVVVDNRGGAEWAQVQLRATDPERVVKVELGRGPGPGPSRPDRLHRGPVHRAAA